jgi:hypothetical protein
MNPALVKLFRVGYKIDLPLNPVRFVTMRQGLSGPPERLVLLLRWPSARLRRPMRGATPSGFKGNSIKSHN